MRRVLAISIAVNVLLLAGFCWTWMRMDASAYQSGAKKFALQEFQDGKVVDDDTRSGNGDANGDGVRDLTDAIRLLTWLFQGGAAPVQVSSPLPATGQTKCYGTASLEIACDSAVFPGQDGFYQAGCPAAGRFVDNGDASVTDACTGLMWQKDTADIGGNGTIGQEDIVDWIDALHYCEDLDSGGHTDWRLPNVRELQSIVDYGRWDPAIDPIFRAEPSWYWSSTTDAHLPELEWISTWQVEFSLGAVYYSGFPDERRYVRAVRTIQPGE